FAEKHAVGRGTRQGCYQRSSLFNYPFAVLSEDLTASGRLVASRMPYAREQIRLAASVTHLPWKGAQQLHSPATENLRPSSYVLGSTSYVPNLSTTTKGTFVRIVSPSPDFVASL